MTHPDIFERVLASMQDATLDDSLWPATSALIDEACGATGNGLVVCESFGENVGIVHAAIFFRGQPCEDLQREYLEVYYQLDERVPRLRQLPESQLAPVSSLFTEKELKTSSVYNESLRKMGAQNGLNVRLDGPAGCGIFWGTADPCGPGDWGPDQIAMIKRLLPHIRHFVWVRRALAAAGALAASLTELLDNSRVGVIHLDHYGRLSEVNNRGLDILRRRGGLSENKGYPIAWEPADNENFQRLLEGALPLSAGNLPTGGATAVRRLPPLPSLLVHVLPISTFGSDRSLGGLGAMVVVVDPMSQPCISPGLISKTFGLTPAESRVAAMLAEGKTVSEIALATGRQKSAIYWLLRQIYPKLGISRQVDLVRMVLSLSDLSESRG